MKDLSNKKVAILATDGFEQSELFEPKKYLEKLGADVHVVAPKEGRIKGWDHGVWGDEVDVDVTVDDADESIYDALVLPGGVINPDKLRRNPEAVEFVRRFFESHKPVASICHGPQMLIEAGVVKGRTLTSFFSIKTDLDNAGAIWIDEKVVVDNGLVTSRGPDDLEAFNDKIAEEILEGKHENQRP